LFKTARFKIHNPSRHKKAVIAYALQHYHLTLRRLLEQALAGGPALQEEITKIGKNGKPRTDKSALSRLLYRLAPKNWPLAPLRDYLIGDASAAILSYYEKRLKGDTGANPPSLHSLEPPSEAERQKAFDEFATTEFSPSAEHLVEIEEAIAAGQNRRAKKLDNIYSARAEREAVRGILRKLDTPLPRPIEFTRHEFGRGFMLARKGDNFYFLVRLFAKGNSRWNQVVLDEEFVDLRTNEHLGGKKYPGLVLPLEFGRDYHETEYLGNGTPKSAKLMLKRNDEGEEELYVHIAFEFTPDRVTVESYLGIDRGSARIGAATIVDSEGRVVVEGLDLVGDAFHRELKQYERRIAELQRRGSYRPRPFRIRGRWANIVIGEYANRVIEAALKHKAQIVLEDLQVRSMARYFLSRSQCAKLHAALEYKAERAGLPKPITVPAAYTSQTCALCGHQDRLNRPKKDAEGRPLQAVFRCLSCGREANADANASAVIALRGLHQIMKGGRFQKFVEFQDWLKALRRDGRKAHSFTGAALEIGE
jgi:IS605 OrfB family transposase